MVTRRGIDTAVVVSIEDWQKLKDEKCLTGRMSFSGKARVLTFPCRSEAKVNRASLRC